mmetsp:Transcript_51478/g.115801  ORF Transcript_51478/g.115801 Transcript_51478/m.115801 type:complete len:303 (+) Transcript_51478:2427-3335(+)
MKVSCAILPLVLPPLASAKTWSSVSSFLAMVSRSTEDRVCTLLPTRNSSPPCSRRGPQVVFAFSISASILSRKTWLSARSFLEAYFCSWSLRTFLALASSTMDSDSFSCSFCKGSVKEAEPLASFCLAARKLRVSSIFAWTSLAWPVSCSHRVEASSSVMLSAMKGSTASTSFFTSAATAVMFSPASCTCAVFLRLSVSRLNWLSLAADALMRSVCLRNSSTTGLETAASNLFTSRFFEAMKVLTSLIRVCTDDTRASDWPMVSVASCSGRISMPLRKGSSTSFTFWMAVSSSDVSLSPSLT